MGKAFSQSKLAANVTEEADWYLDTPDVRLTRIFMVVLILHVIAVGGILAFKMIDKAAGSAPMQLASKSSVPAEAVTNSVEVSGQEQVAASASAATQAAAVAPVVDAVAKPAVSQTGKVASGEGQYKVLAGDSLPEIARELGVSADALRKANDIRSDNELYPGRWLDIPKANAVAEAPAVTAPVAQAAASAPQAASKPAESKKSYTVQSGDTAWGISRKFGVNFQELMSFNGIDKPEGLQIGQTLKIPE